MKKLTVQDLIEQGYFNSMADIAQRCEISVKTVEYWKYKRDGLINRECLPLVVYNARKPLRITDIASFEGRRKRNDGGKRWEKTKLKKLITTELAPKVKNKELSGWILAMAGAGGHDA